jgi:hypothetical protein
MYRTLVSNRINTVKSNFNLLIVVRKYNYRIVIGYFDGFALRGEKKQMR